MPFPEYQRVVYPRNPIAEVICQFRYPSILKIASESPAEFQERIRHLYPIFEEKKRVQSSKLPDNSQILLQEAVNFLSTTTDRSYEFISEDQNWVISLTSGFLALTAKKYTNWEDFKNHFQEPFEALKEEYNPSYFERIGLRYQNIIDRADWKLESTSWDDLINPYLLGIIEDPYIGEDVVEGLSQNIISLGDDIGKILIRYGLVHRLKNNVPEDKLSYLLDNDFFVEGKIEVKNGLTKLDEFHTQSGKVFHWGITDRFRQAMAISK